MCMVGCKYVNTSRSMKWLVDKPNSVWFHLLPKQQTKWGSHFSWRPTHPVFTCVNWSGQLYPDWAFAKSETGSTRSCTKRGFSCPDATKGRTGIAHATIVITDDAVVSYTTFSPFSRLPLAKKSGCVFSVILSVSAGYCLQNPRFLNQKRTEPLLTDTRGALPCGVRTFLPFSSQMKMSGCLTHHLLLLDPSSSFLNKILPTVWLELNKQCSIC